MVLTREELVASLQNEVRILLHLASKIDRSQLDYRPTSNQRSTLELLRYLTMMGPECIACIRCGVFDPTSWQAAQAAADRLDFDQVLAALEKQSTRYAELIGEFSDADLRDKIDLLFWKGSRGSVIVNLVLCGQAAYRAQLFLYLKACGCAELSTSNLWGGVEAAATA
jgi:hypothetical protein